MTWIIYGMALCVSLLAILFGEYEYKRTNKDSDLLICGIGCGLLAFSLMSGAILIFVL